MACVTQKGFNCVSSSYFGFVLFVIFLATVSADVDPATNSVDPGDVVLNGRADIDEKMEDLVSDDNETSISAGNIQGSNTSQPEKETNSITVKTNNASTTNASSSDEPANVTRPDSSAASAANPEPDEKEVARTLAYRFMGSLAVAYVLICIILAIKNGPMFTS